MIVNYKLPEMQRATPRYFQTYVVLGPNHPDRPGQIKTVRVSSTLSNSLVSVQCKFDAGGRATFIQSMNIAADQEQYGTSFLKELYSAAGRMDNWALWCKHQDAIAQGLEVDAFPDSRLPPCLLEWRQRKGSRGVKFTIPEDGEPLGELEDDIEPEPEPSPAPAVRRRRATSDSPSEAA